MTVRAKHARLPGGVVLGARWRPKRGYENEPRLSIVQIYRSDHSVLARGHDGALRVIHWNDLRQRWRPS